MTLVRTLRQRVPWDRSFADTSPLFAPLRVVAEPFRSLSAFPSPEEIHERLGSHAGVAFVRSETLPQHSGRVSHTPRKELDLYDARIHLERSVPTRPESWHDFLNALVWALFPRAKWALHVRQHGLVARGLDPETGRLPGARTREQDALALFDEGGLAVSCAEPLVDGAAIERAIDAGAAKAIVFGHAIYESYVLGAPWPMVRAIVVPERGPDLDAGIARVLSDPASLCEPASLPRVALTPLLRSDSPRSSTAP
jgi:hypothetical protein